MNFQRVFFFAVLCFLLVVPTWAGYIGIDGDILFLETIIAEGGAKKGYARIKDDMVPCTLHVKRIYPILNNKARREYDLSLSIDSDFCGVAKSLGDIKQTDKGVLIDLTGYPSKSGTIWLFEVARTWETKFLTVWKKKLFRTKKIRVEFPCSLNILKKIDNNAILADIGKGKLAGLEYIAENPLSFSREDKKALVQAINFAVFSEKSSCDSRLSKKIKTLIEKILSH